MKINIMVPTFNRSQYLLRAVESIKAQLHQLPNEVDVVIQILDNASTDDTLSVCEQLKKRLPQLNVISHANNIGGDANILHALNIADGDYVWVFGDDDYLLPGTLAKICNYLLENKVSLLKMNSVEERDCGDKVIGEMPCQFSESAEVSPIKSVTFSSANEILSQFGIGMGNFTTAIFSCDFFRLWYKKPVQKFFESGYSQLAWIYTGLFENPERFIFISEPLVVLRIEMKPRHISSSRVSIGLDFIKKELIDNGYDQGIVTRIYNQQLDAIALGEIKASKVSSKYVGFSRFFHLSKTVSFKTFLKLVIILCIPSQLYRKLWERL